MVRRVHIKTERVVVGLVRELKRVVGKLKPNIKLIFFCALLCRIVFPSRKKNRRSDEIVHKKYILMTETFEFGPLLVGKSRDK